MSAEAAGEKSVAVGDVHDVASPAAGGADGARHHRGPRLDVVARVPDDRRLARRSGRRVHTNDVGARHGKHAERIVVAQIRLGREGKPGEIVERFEVAGMNARLLECSAVMRHVVERGAQRPAQPLHLQRRELVAARGLDRLEISLAGRLRRHCRPFRPTFSARRRCCRRRDSSFRGRARSSCPAGS